MDCRKATVVVDLGFGDAGKGTIVDYLARKCQAPVVVRFNGGPQARHHVVTRTGQCHGFAQFGSGSFVPGARTHLSRFMLFDPIELNHEWRWLDRYGLGDVLDRLTVDEDAIMVTPLHALANTIRETLRGDDRHGTCGMGIGETVAHSLAFPEEAIHARDMRDGNVLVRKIARIQDRLFAELWPRVPELPDDALRSLADKLIDPRYPANWTDEVVRFGRKIDVCDSERLAHFARESDLLFEGAQGVLLDEWYGFHPHTTWSTTTFANALTLLDEIKYGECVERIGVMRAYHTRHGEGPFPTADALLTRIIPDRHNDNMGWQGHFRVGWFDMVLARYALAVSGGADALAITNLDRFRTVPERKVCTAYRAPGGDFIDRLTVKSELTDLTHQEALTHLLHQVEPQYEDAPMNDEQYLQMIERDLGVPVAITSYGPTAADKRMRLPAVLAA